MKKADIEGFDGYADVVGELAACRRCGTDYRIDDGAAENWVERIHPRQLTLRVLAVTAETADASTLRLVSDNGPLPPFLAGQYITVDMKADGIVTARPYSISSPPNQRGHYDITVRRVPGGLFSNHLLDRVRPGDMLSTSGPRGHFYFNPLFHDRAMVLLAGGCGITPMMSMIREIVETGLDRTAWLFYGNRTIKEVIFHDRLKEYDQTCAGFHYVPVIETPSPGDPGKTGFITGDLIRETIGDLSAKTFYICGPRAMYDACIPDLEKQGVAGRKIRREVNQPSENICQIQGWPRQVKAEQVFTLRVNGERTIKTRADQPLIRALEKGGVMVPTSCRAGECSRCRVKIVSGSVFQPPDTPVRSSDRRWGYVHSCVSYALSDLEIQV